MYGHNEWIQGKGRVSRAFRSINTHKTQLLILFGAMALLGACDSGTSNPAGSGAAPQLAAQTMTINSSDCQIPANPPAAQADPKQFYEYAWRLFVAMNWPAKSGERGEADCSKLIGNAGITVWESYKTTQQTFLKNAKEPAPWNQGEIGQLKLDFDSKAPGELKLPPSIRQAVGGWLIDQNKNPTYYEIAFDKDSFNYIRSNQFYNADVLDKATQVNFPYGALEIKASWRILPNGANASRYLSKKAEVAIFDSQGNDTGKYKSETVGLVGLHIVYKPKGFPQWIWATFEQVDNLSSDPNHAGYYNPSCSGQYCTPNVSPVKSHQPFGSPNQITRITPINSVIQQTNATWQQKLSGSGWAKYYQLISPQWPTDPNDPGNPQGTPFPGTVANVTMESYIQPTSSCMDCHSTARTPNSRIKTNYSFVFLFAQKPAK